MGEGRIGAGGRMVEVGQGRGEKERVGRVGGGRGGEDEGSVGVGCRRENWRVARVGRFGKQFGTVCGVELKCFGSFRGWAPWCWRWPGLAVLFHL